MSRSPGAAPALGETVELSIEKAVYRGRGLGRVGGCVVFVRRTFPGDRLQARVKAVHGGWAEAEPIEILQPSPARRPAPCPNGPECGGCSYQDIDYEEQLRLKESVLRESLARAGAPFEGVIERIASPEQGWRLRATLHFAVAAGGLRLGVRDEGSHRVTGSGDCQQLSPRMNEAVRALRERLAPWNGLHPRLRGLDLFEAPDGSALVGSLVTALRPHELRELAALGRQVPGLTGFGIETHPARLHWLHGDPHVEASVLGTRLRAHVSSFFQPNRFLLEPLAREVRELVPRSGGRILDLYSGVGLFSLPLAARDDAAVIAVEHAATSCEDARANARRQRLPVRVIESDVAEALAALPAEADERIVMDPPRTGAGPVVVDRVAARRPGAVVYVSCDPPTLGRDLARFATHGYRPDCVRLIDQFPNTYHVETLVRLRPEADRKL